MGETSGSVQLLREDRRGDPYDRFLEFLGSAAELRVPPPTPGYPGGPSRETVQDLVRAVRAAGAQVSVSLSSVLSTRGPLRKRRTIGHVRLVAGAAGNLVAAAETMATLLLPPEWAGGALPVVLWPHPRRPVGRALPGTFHPDPSYP
jgi:hypothetical protein